MGRAEQNRECYRLYQEAMKHHISIAPGQIFSSRGAYANCIRIGYGKGWDSTIDYGLKVLGNLIKKQMKIKAI